MCTTRGGEGSSAPAAKRCRGNPGEKLPILCGRPTRSGKPCRWSVGECPVQQYFETTRKKRKGRWPRCSQPVLASGPEGMRRMMTSLRALEVATNQLTTVADG